jgi:hypothetical protein
MGAACDTPDTAPKTRAAKPTANTVRIMLSSLNAKLRSPSA